jgi:hypothetical protein
MQLKFQELVLSRFLEVHLQAEEHLLFQRIMIFHFKRKCAVSGEIWCFAWIEQNRKDFDDYIKRRNYAEIKNSCIKKIFNKDDLTGGARRLPDKYRVELDKLLGF